VTLISENPIPRRRTSPSARLPIIDLAWGRREYNFLTAGALLKGEIDLLVYKVSFSTAQIITKLTSITIINYFIQYADVIVIYCKILKDIYIYCVDKILLHGNSYWLVSYLFVG
jgi:hypothetical protein